MEHMGLGVFCMKFVFSYHMLLIFVDLPKQTDVCFKTVFPMKNHAVYMYRIKTCLPILQRFSPKNSSDHQDDTPWKTYTIFVTQLWLVVGVKLMEMISNLFSR